MSDKQTHFNQTEIFFTSNLFPHRHTPQAITRHLNSSLRQLSQTVNITQPPTPDKTHHKHHQTQPESSKIVKIQFKPTEQLGQKLVIRKRFDSVSDKIYDNKKLEYFNFIREGRKTNKKSKLINFFKISTKALESESDHLEKFAKFNQLDAVHLEKREKKEKKERKVNKLKGRTIQLIKLKGLQFKVHTQASLYEQQQDLNPNASFYLKSIIPNIKHIARKHAHSTNDGQQQKKHNSNSNNNINSNNNSNNNINNNKHTATIAPFIVKSTKKVKFVFGLSEKDPMSVFEKMHQNLKNYHDLLWKINYANGLYVRATGSETTYKAYIGPGNNSNLIKSILRRRYWWIITDKPSDCNFIWTQLKHNTTFNQHQKNSQTPQHIYKLQKYQIDNILKTNNSEPCNFWNKLDEYHWLQHLQKNYKYEVNINEKTYINRANLYQMKEISRYEHSKNIIVHNHLQQNEYIANKKALFHLIHHYNQTNNHNPFQLIPITFHIRKGTQDPAYHLFLTTYQQFQQAKATNSNIRNLWIVKPGQNSNRGNGISICANLDQIKLRINGRQKHKDGQLRSFILQKYIENPLLYKERKFDIRHYLLITRFNGILKAYWFHEGYARTSSNIFSLNNSTDIYTHLTNDAIQQNSKQYGKFQKGNKLSYKNICEYLNALQIYPKNAFYQTVIPDMKVSTINAIKSTYLYLDPHRKEHNFQLFGMDFMIDQHLKPWLIQINSNPCLELCCPLLQKIIPNLIENILKVCVDTMFPPPQEWNNSKKVYFNNAVEQLGLQLIFDQSVEGGYNLDGYADEVSVKALGKIEQDNCTYDDQGNSQIDETY